MLPFSAAKVLCGVPPGGKAAAERPVQVEAAAASGAVQRFPHEVQPRTALELEGRFHLGQGKPAAGGLRLPPAAGGKPLAPPVLGGAGKLLPAACRQGVVLTTADGTEYGLHHVTNIWHGTKLGFNADDPYFASIIGKTVTQITFYAADGVYVLPVNVAL